MKTQLFIDRAKSIHGDRYDYSESIYHYRNPVKIICREHGPFYQRYDHHLDKARSGGCRKCYFDSLILSQDDVIKRSKKIHGEKFDYSKTIYVDSRKKFIVTCKVHGDFLTTPSNHMAGKNCAKCTNEEKILSHSEFINKSNAVHNGKYSYEKSIYTGCSKWLIITCPIHGDFEKTPDNHCHKTVPQGCPKCAEYHGYLKHEIGYLYALKSVNDLYIKVGITNNPKKRIKSLQKATPFEFKLESFKKFKDGSEPPIWERLFHRTFESANLTGFDGCTEWMLNTPRLMEWFDEI